MVIPSPGVMMPTMRSPGTAPPSGAKRTGNSPFMPRIGIAASSFGSALLPLKPGMRNFRPAARASPNQPSLRGGLTRFSRSSRQSGLTARTTSLEP